MWKNAPCVGVESRAWLPGCWATSTPCRSTYLHSHSMGLSQTSPPPPSTALLPTGGRFMGTPPSPTSPWLLGLESKTVQSTYGRPRVFCPNISCAGEVNCLRIVHSLTGDKSCPAPVGAKASGSDSGPSPREHGESWMCNPPLAPGGGGLGRAGFPRLRSTGDSLSAVAWLLARSEEHTSELQSR